MRRPAVLLLALGFLALGGCDKIKQHFDSGSSDKGSGASSSSSSYSSSGSIGVSECDDYIRAYKSCLSDKVPEGDRATLQSALDTNVDYWRQLAANPDAKEKLRDACKEASDSASNSLQAFGCSF
jgi:hypothetical protein